MSFFLIFNNSYVEDVCNNRASIIDQNTIQITWDVNAKDPSVESIQKSQSTIKFQIN